LTVRLKHPRPQEPGDRRQIPRRGEPQRPHTTLPLTSSTGRPLDTRLTALAPRGALGVGVVAQAVRGPAAALAPVLAHILRIIHQHLLGLPTPGALAPQHQLLDDP